MLILLFKHLDSGERGNKEAKVKSKTIWKHNNTQTNYLWHRAHSLCFSTIFILFIFPFIYLSKSSHLSIIVLAFLSSPLFGSIFISLCFLPDRSTPSTYHCPAPRSVHCAWPCCHEYSLRCSCARGDTGSRSLPRGWSTLCRWHRCSSPSCIH